MALTAHLCHSQLDYAWERRDAPGESKLHSRAPNRYHIDTRFLKCVLFYDHSDSLLCTDSKDFYNMLLNIKLTHKNLLLVVSSSPLNGPVS